MRVRPQPGDEETVATPYSADYSETIDRMIDQLSNKATGGRPELAGSVMGGTADKIANVVSGYLKMFSDDPRTTIPTPLKITNPNHFLAGVAEKYYPKMYKHLDKSPINYTFKTMKGGPNVGVASRNRAVTDVDIKIRDDIQQILEDIQHPDPTSAQMALKFHAENNPRRLYDALTVLPHEMGHSVRYRPAQAGKADAYVRRERQDLYEQGMPTPKKQKGPYNPDSPVQELKHTRVGNRIQHTIDTGRQGNARIDPYIVEWAKRGYPEGTVRADEALIQQAAQNQVRNSGIVPRGVAKTLEDFMNRRYGK